MHLVAYAFGVTLPPELGLDSPDDVDHTSCQTDRDQSRAEQTDVDRRRHKFACARSKTMMSAPPHEGDDQTRWSRLNNKHREVLNLLIERKTSKEIARIFGVSKPAIDQRFASARLILGAANRNEVAIIYARLRQTYDQIICDPVQVPKPTILLPSDFPDGDPDPVLKLSDIATPTFGTENGSREILLPFGEGWKHTYGIQARVVIMVAMLVALVSSVFLALGSAESLTRLVSN